MTVCILLERHKTKAHLGVSSVGITKELKRYKGIKLQNMVPLKKNINIIFIEGFSKSHSLFEKSII
jgi:hypothetical protein